MTAYLLDSGFLYASIDKTDKFHEAAAEIAANIRGQVYLPIPAVTETAFFLMKNIGSDAVAEFLESLANTHFILVAPVSSDFSRAAEIVRKYSDVNLDFVDVLIFAISERLMITKILTVDRRHFSLYRPLHCIAFEIYP